MEEITVSGIVVGSEDHKESDKLVRILTAEFGVISAVMRGVKKEKAKLKYASMPFSFCQFTLMKRGAYYTVKTASQIESLLGVTYTPEKYVSASVMLEAATAAAGGTDSAEVFVSLLSGLKTLLYSEDSPESVCLKFVTELLVHGGYIAPESEVLTENCAQEKMKLKRYVRLFETKFVCRINSAKLL